MKLLHILQYHNAVVIVLIGVVLILSGYVFAQTDTGQEIIGEKQEKIISVDNKALLEADLDNFDMQFKILEIQQDNATYSQANYYVNYSYRDLILQDSSWQWQEKQKTAEISEKAFENRDLGDYLAEEFSEVAYWRQKELKEKQDKAQQIGPTEKLIVTEYSGLIGKVLDIKNAVFPGYEPVIEVAQIVPEIVPEISMINNQDTNNNQLPITNDQTIEPELQELPSEPPVIKHATSTEE